jgi:microcystin-dependent protein
MASIINAGTTTSTALNIITDTTGTLAIQTSGANAINISSSQVVTLTNPLAAGSGGTGVSSLGTGVATALGQNVTGSGGIVLGTSPSVDSPTLTGTPIAPTAAAGTNTTQIATTAFVQANNVPTGSLLMWSTSSAPIGYLICDGTAVSRTTYAALFAVIGTTFGSGNGSTTFNVPNYTNRMPYGTTVGATGGSADAIVVSHTHTATSTVTDPGHLHGVNGRLNGGGGNPGGDWNGYGDYGNTTFTNTTGITVATTNSTTGVSGTNANLPPYLGINFIIRT